MRGASVLLAKLQYLIKGALPKVRLENAAAEAVPQFEIGFDDVEYDDHV